MFIEPRKARGRDAIVVFHDSVILEDAIGELVASGFESVDLHLVAGSCAIEAKLGHVYERLESAQELEILPRLAYTAMGGLGIADIAMFDGLMAVGADSACGPIVASGGALALAITASVISCGGSEPIAAVLRQWVSDYIADYLQEQLDGGGLLLWVHLSDLRHERCAVEILARHSARSTRAASFSILPGTRLIGDQVEGVDLTASL